MFFRLKKESKVFKGRTLGDIRNLFEHVDIRNIFRFKKKNKVIKDRLLRDVTNLFEHEEIKHYQLKIS